METTVDYSIIGSAVCRAVAIMRRGIKGVELGKDSL